jgi:hypothetical protein
MRSSIRRWSMGIDQPSGRVGRCQLGPTPDSQVDGPLRPNRETGTIVTEDEELAALSAAMIPRFFFGARWSVGVTAKLLPTVSATATFTVQTPAPAERIETALEDLGATV